MSGIAGGEAKVRGAAKRMPRWQERRFFLLAAVAMLLFVLAGFSSSFYLRGIVVSRASAPAPEPYLIIHGGVMTAWYVLFVVQSYLIARGRSVEHRMLGTLGAFVAAAVALTGAYVSARFPSHLAALGLPSDQVMQVGLVTAIANLVILTWFIAFVTAAILLRRHREWHGRLMLWSYFITLPPAFANGPDDGARLLGPMVETYLPGWPVVPLLFALLWASMLAVEWRARKRIHPATLVCPFLVLASVGTIIAAMSAFSTPATLALFLKIP